MKKIITTGAFVMIFVLLLCISKYFESRNFEKIHAVSNKVSVEMQYYDKTEITNEDIQQLHLLTNEDIPDNYNYRATFLCRINNQSEYTLAAIHPVSVKNETVFVSSNVIDEGGTLYYPNTKFEFITYVYLRDNLSEEEIQKLMSEMQFNFQYEISENSEKDLSVSDKEALKITAKIVENELPTDDVNNLYYSVF